MNFRISTALHFLPLICIGFCAADWEPEQTRSLDNRCRTAFALETYGIPDFGSFQEFLDKTSQVEEADDCDVLVGWWQEDTMLYVHHPARREIFVSYWSGSWKETADLSSDPKGSSSPYALIKYHTRSIYSGGEMGFRRFSPFKKGLCFEFQGIISTTGEPQLTEVSAEKCALSEKFFRWLQFLSERG